jgi:hypothetical protein
MARPISKASRKVVQRLVLAFVALLVLTVPGDTTLKTLSLTKNISAKAAGRDARNR